MPEPTLELRLRPATLEDAALVADLESLRDPMEPRDPVLLRHWWRMADEHEKTMRQVDVRDGAAVAFVSVAHEPWADQGRERFGTVRALLRYDVWQDEVFAELVAIAERWLREQDAQFSVARVREDFPREIVVLEGLGYREDRRMRVSELDLVARREEVRRLADESRRSMTAQNVAMLPLSEDKDPDKLRKLYDVMMESEKDIPTTVPRHEPDFEEWRAFWLDNPAIRQDRFWIAREGDAIVGTSVLDCPTVRGVPWTAYTGTARSVRGRGIARALKYQSMAQAIDAGYTRVRTNNDADNPAILKINREMGYRLISPIIELHRNLGA
jgi:RimJ/RimL family protein N-acetyltransferase